jgi:1-acyl-sn-glycerol-3-phosphate acyltransferase
MQVSANSAGDAESGAAVYHFCSLTRNELIALSDGSDVEQRKNASIPLSKCKKEEFLQQEPLGFWEHLACVLFLLIGVPNGVFSVPVITFLVGKFVVRDVALAFKTLGLLLLPLVFLPQPFVRSSLHSWMAVKVIKYFSFRFISEEHCRPMNPDDPITIRPQILVAPPHGVFPYGNLLAMLTWPCYCGYHFHGLAADAALRVPIFKQILKSIGVIDASRTSARKALERWPHTIGISTGGVAEVFETNANDECILLRERVGLIKLAIRTGADLIPCYLFGNTKLLSCWSGEGIPNGRKLLEKMSRKVGFALIIFHGRFGLPIPRRIPILSVKGKPVSTFQIQCEEPSPEQIQIIQERLIAEMEELFDKYKHLYGWEDKRLVVK